MQRLGEDVEACLNQLVFGTVRRSLRYQIAEEMRKHGFLRPYEDNVLERISLIEVITFPNDYLLEEYLGLYDADFTSTSSLLDRVQKEALS